MILAHIGPGRNALRFLREMKEIWKILRNLVLIIKNQQQKLFFTYARLELKYLIKTRLLKQKITSEKVFDWQINFFDYQTFLYTFEEIFIGQGYFFETTEKAPLIFDCGSNIGMSILYFKKLWPNCRIISFEPDKKTFSKLRENIEFNKLDQIKLNNVALAQKPGQLNFYCDRENPGSLIASTIERHPGQTYEKVEALTLSEQITEKVDFLKIDIEGAETGVFIDLAESKKLRLIEDICLEYHHHIEKDKDNLSIILRILEENNFGYQISSINQPPLKKRKFQDILIRGYKK